MQQKLARVIGPEEARQLGVWTAHTKMENGETRFRLRCKDGTSYIRTESSKFGGWQNSHFHRRVQETYIVQAGRMAFADLASDICRVRIFEKNSVVTTMPLVPHNVYLYANSVIHTIKHGDEGLDEDRIPYPDLDVLTHQWSEADISEVANRSE